MVLVDEPAVGPPYLVHQLTHAVWNGWTVADTVFPAFLFVMGLVFVWRPRRIVVLFLLGLALNVLPLVLAGGGFGHLRIMGVLQRIALAAAVASLVPRRRAALGAVLVLAVIWAVYATRPLTPAANLPGVIDRHVLGTAHMYPGGNDPEGLLASVPAAASVLIGVGAGDLVRAGRRVAVLLAGLGLLAVGSLWSIVLPINKRVWTPSYVVFMAGVAMVALAVCMVIDDRRWGVPLRAVGSNPLVVYVGASVTGIVLSAMHHGHLPFTYWVWNRWLRGPLGGTFGNVVWAIGILAIWWAIAGALWRRKLFVRL